MKLLVLGLESGNMPYPEKIAQRPGENLQPGLRRETPRFGRENSGFRREIMEGESRRTGWYLVIFLVTPDLLGRLSMPQIVATNAGLRGWKFISVRREMGFCKLPL